VLSIPDRKSKLQELVVHHWEDLQDADESTIRYLSKPNRIPDLTQYSADDVLQAINDISKLMLGKEEGNETEDLKFPELFYP